jgi:hypothetical protein
LAILPFFGDFCHFLAIFGEVKAVLQYIA